MPHAPSLDIIEFLFDCLFQINVRGWLTKKGSPPASIEGAAGHPFSP